jgi:hypothetical protein
MQWVEERLRQWSDWARGNQLTNNQQNPLAAMMRIAAGEVPGRDLDVPYDLIPQIEITEKAIARLREQNPRYKRVIMRYWLGRVPVFEIATEFRTDDRRTKEILHRAEAQVGRNIIMLENGLTEEYFKRKMISRKRGEGAL